MKIVLNSDKILVNKIQNALKENQGYCPCIISRTISSKCMCQEFREQTSEGLCHCGLYMKLSK